MGESSERSRTSTRAIKVVLRSAPMTMANAAKLAISPFLAKDEISRMVAVELCKKKVTNMPEKKEVKRFFVPREMTRFRYAPNPRKNPRRTFFSPHSKRQTDAMMCMNKAVIGMT